MTKDKLNSSSFEFQPEPVDTVRLHLDPAQWTLIEDTSTQPKLDVGFDPYNTGAGRAKAQANKKRKKF